MSPEHFHTIIQEFSPIGLDEMNTKSQLMDRVDTKFVLTINQFTEILSELKNEYKVLEIDGVRLSNYESEYFDDDVLSFYIDHHRQKVDRFKVRFRKYVESNIAFLEVKHKKKGRTNKQRILVDDLPGGPMTKKQSSFVKSTGVNQNKLNHVLTNKFSRLTLVGINHNERLTFDLNLTFTNKKKEVVLSHIVIAELKQTRVIRTSPFFSLMKKKLIRPYRISKYCIGIIELLGKENVKYNRFKKKILKIQKLKKHVA
jgi:hypothetical protein